MLYREENVRENLRNRDGKRVFYLGKGDQLTSTARDWLSRERIEILPAQQVKRETFRLLNGGFVTEKPEHMTHLNAQLLVCKNHPRILFRGKLDTLEAELILCQLTDPALAKPVGEVLDLARKMGVDAAVNTAKEDLPQIMKEQGLVEGFDVGLEMSGNGAALQQMIGAMRNGGKISLLGISNKPVPMDMNTIITKGLTLQGIYGRKMDNWHQMSYMIQGGLDLSPVITHRFHYTDFEQGFAAMNSGKSGKVVLDWTTKK